VLLSYKVKNATSVEILPKQNMDSITINIVSIIPISSRLQIKHLMLLGGFNDGSTFFSSIIGKTTVRYCRDFCLKQDLWTTDLQWSRCSRIRFCFWISDKDFIKNAFEKGWLNTEIRW
jgi:hypothetical protein